MMRVSLAVLIAFVLVAVMLLNLPGNLYGAPGEDKAKVRDGGANVLPDLVVDAMSIEDTANTTCVANPSVLHLRARVSNQGSVPAASFVVTANGQRQSAAGLEAGATVWALFEHSGGGQYTAVVDADNQVDESDEGNNQTVQYVPIPTQLPPCIQKSLFLPQVSR